MVTTTPIERGVEQRLLALKSAGPVDDSLATAGRLLFILLALTSGRPATWHGEFDMATFAHRYRVVRG